MVSRQKFRKIMNKYSLGLWAVPKGLNQEIVPGQVVSSL